MIPSGTAVTGAFGFSANLTAVTATELKEVVSLPGLATNDLTDDLVNFGNAVAVGDPDPACTGRALAPTAPARAGLHLPVGVGRRRHRRYRRGHPAAQRQPRGIRHPRGQGRRGDRRLRDLGLHGAMTLMAPADVMSTGAAGLSILALKGHADGRGGAPGPPAFRVTVYRHRPGFGRVTVRERNVRA